MRLCQQEICHGMVMAQGPPGDIQAPSHRVERLRLSMSPLFYSQGQGCVCELETPRGPLCL